MVKTIIVNSELPEEFLARLNGVERSVPPVVSVVDFKANAEHMIHVYEATKRKEGGAYSLSEEDEIRGGLLQLSSLERLYHMLYHDSDGGKLMRFLFDGPYALLSRNSAKALGLSVDGGMSAGKELGVLGKADEALGHEDFVFLSKGVETVSERSPSQESAMIVVSPRVLDVQGVCAFNFEDTDALNKWLRFMEKCGTNLPVDECRTVLRSLMLSPRDLDGVRVKVGLASEFVLDSTPLREAEREAYERENVVFRESALRGVRVDFYLEHVWGVEKAFFEDALGRSAVFNGGVAGRIVDDEDDDLRYLPYLTKPAYESKEVIVPEGVGGLFIEKVVVRDDLYPRVVERAEREGLSLGGRRWSDIIVSSGEDKKSPQVSEALRIQERLSKVVGR